MLPKIINKNYFFGLDSLRAISLLLVVVSHVFFNDGSEIDNLHLGAIGVDVFFVISGFLITTLICKELVIYGKFNIQSFLIRRAFRILPVVCVFCFVLIILNSSFNLDLSINSIVTGLLFVKNLPFADGNWENGHLWSLSVEEQFYIVYPSVIFLLGIKRYWWVMMALLLMIPIISYLNFHEIVYCGVVNKIIEYCANIFGMGTFMIIIGSIGALWIYKRPYALDFILKLKYKSLSAGVIFSLIIFMVIPHENVFHIPYFLNKFFFGIGILIVILINLSVERKNLLFWDNPVLVYIGKLSYSLYIWQQLFTHNQPWGGAIFPNLVCLLLVAMASYHLVETKFIKLRKSLRY